MALDVITSISLDMQSPYSTTDMVHVNQYDSGLRVKAALLNAGQKWEVPSGAKAVVAFKKSDNIGGFYDVTDDDPSVQAVSIDSDRSVIYISLDTQTTTTSTTANKYVDMQVVFYQNGKRLSTFAFYMDVRPSVVTSKDVASSWMFKILSKEIADTLTVATTPAAMTAWLNENIKSTVRQGAYAIDNTLTLPLYAADAEATGKMVTVSDQNPNTVANKVWVKKTPYEVQVPTMDDLKDSAKSQSLYYDQMAEVGPTSVVSQRIYTVRKTHIETEVTTGSITTVYYVLPLFGDVVAPTKWSVPMDQFFSGLTYVPIDFDIEKWDLYLNLSWDHINSSSRNDIFIITKNISTDEVTYISFADNRYRVRRLNLFDVLPAIKENQNFTLVFRSRNSGYPNNLDYSLTLEANSAVTDSIIENSGKTMTLFYDIMSDSVSSEAGQRKFTVTKNKAKVEAVTASPNSTVWLTVPLFGNFTSPLSLTDDNVQTVLQSCNFYSLNFDFLKSELFININWKNCYHQAPTESARNEILIATKDPANSTIELSCISNDSDYEITRYNLLSILPSIKKNNNFLLLFQSRNASYTNEVYYSLELEAKATSISKDSKIVDFSSLFKLDAAFSNKDKKNLRYYSIKETPIQSLKIVLPEYQSGTGMPNIDNIRPYKVYSQDVEIYTSGHDKTNYATRNLSFLTTVGNILSGSFDIINGTFIRNKVWEILYPDNLPYIKFIGSSSSNRILIASNLISTNRIKSNASQTCSHASYISSAGGTYSDRGMSLFHMYPESRNIYFSVPGLTSREEYINYITEQYNLGTPVTFAAEIPEETLELFSKIEIRSVLGINNIWTNSQDAILSASFSTGIKTLCDFEKNDYQKQRPNIFQNGIIALRDCFNHIVWSDGEGLIKLNTLDALINAIPSNITPRESLAKQADEIIAIIDCLAHVAWADSDGFEYFSLLEEFTELEGINNLKNYDDVPYYNQRVLVFGNALMLILDCIQHALWSDADAATYYNIYNNIINDVD